MIASAADYRRSSDGATPVRAQVQRIAGWQAKLAAMPRRAVLVGLGFALLPLGAEAANALRPRTPAQFFDVPCMLVVDKRAEPVLHLEYAVPFEDPGPGGRTHDELPDTRVHQFFAFDHMRWNFALPNWINQEDYDRSEANGDFTREYTPDDILERSSLWPAPTWQRITPDDDRLPISHERADLGVDWPLDDVPVGTWVVAVYTWEPDNNLWSLRPGAIKVVDPNDPDSGAPAAFLSFDTPQQVTAYDPFPLAGCIDAEPGSTFTASWGVLIGNDEPQWVPFAEDEPASTGALELPFAAPGEAENERVKVRLEVTDPQGRSYVAYTPPMRVLPNPDTGGESDDGDGDGGCGCRAQPDPGLATLGLLVLLLAGRSRAVHRRR